MYVELAWSKRRWPLNFSRKSSLYCPLLTVNSFICSCKWFLRWLSKSAKNKIFLVRKNKQVNLVRWFHSNYRDVVAWLTAVLSLNCNLWLDSAHRVFFASLGGLTTRNSYWQTWLTTAPFKTKFYLIYAWKCQRIPRVTCRVHSRPWTVQNELPIVHVALKKLSWKKRNKIVRVWVHSKLITFSPVKRLILELESLVE